MKAERLAAMLTLGAIAITAIVGVIILALDNAEANQSALIALAAIGSSGATALGSAIVPPILSAMRNTPPVPPPPPPLPSPPEVPPAA